MVSGTHGKDDELPDTLQYPLSAVAQALAKHGYADLTTKKIAAESTRTEAALYRHYDSKDALIEAYLEAAIDWFSWKIESADITDPIERLLRTCEVLTGDSIDWEYYPGFYVAMQELRAYAPRKEAFAEPLQKYHRFMVTSLTEIINDGIEQGAFHRVDPESTAVVVYTFCDAVPRYAIVLELVDEAEMIRNQLYAYIQSGIVSEDTVDRPDEPS